MPGVVTEVPEVDEVGGAVVSGVVGLVVVVDVPPVVLEGCCVVDGVSATAVVAVVTELSTTLGP